MAGDWIKVEHTLPDKPEVVTMADVLGIDQDAVVGKLLRIWIWADQQTISGNGLRVTKAFLDRISCCNNFASVLQQVGWLSGTDGDVSLTNFDRHNGFTSKARATTYKRVKRSRNGKTVTKTLPETETESLSKTSKKRFEIPTFQQVADYCIERANNVDPQRFIDHYTSNGWRVGRNPMKDWKAAIRNTWEKGEFGSHKPSEKSKVATADDLKNWTP